MKKYIDAQLQVVRIQNNVIATSGGVNTSDYVGNSFNSSDVSYGADRFRDWE